MARARKIPAIIMENTNISRLPPTLAADFIIAAESARFADTHAKWALQPVWGISQRLPRRIGKSKAHKGGCYCYFAEIEY